MTSPIFEPETQDSDSPFDLTLRPSSLSDFVGQAIVKDTLGLALEAAAKRKEPLDHLLLYASPYISRYCVSS